MMGPRSKVVALLPVKRMRAIQKASRPLPVLMRVDEVVTLKQAVAICGKSEKTIRRLCARHGLSRQTASSAPLEISLVGLEMALHGDFAAIELLRAGERAAPEVRRYLTHLQLLEGANVTRRVQSP